MTKEEFVKILKKIKMLDPDFFVEAHEAIKQERFEDFCKETSRGSRVTNLDSAIDTIYYTQQLSEENK